MVFRLVLRTFRRDAARLATAFLGVAAAVGLLCWHVGLACTAMHSGADAARRATAPFSAWIAGPADGRGGPGRLGRRPDGAGAPPAGVPRPGAPRAGAPAPTRPTAEPTMGRRFPGRTGPIPPPLVRALSAETTVDGVVPLATLPVSIDIRPGGRVLQGPPLLGVAAALPQSGIPFDVPVVAGRLPDPSSPVPEALAAEGIFGGRVPQPELGSDLPLVMANGTANVRVVGFFRMSSLVQAFPTLYLNPAAAAIVERASPDFPAGPNLALVRMRPGCDPASLGGLVDAVPGGAFCTLYTTDAVADRFRTDTSKNLMSAMPLTLTLAVITAVCLLATVLTIGLSLQRRRIAELRCAGMTRGGVARLVLCETAFLVFPGWLVGLVGSAALLQLFLLSEKASGDLPAVIHLGWQTPLAGLALAVVVGGAALLVPVAAALRVKPLEAIGGDVATVRRVSPRRALLATLLLLPMPVLSLDPALPEKVKSLLMALVGLPAFFAAVALGLHPLMRLTERLFLRPLGSLLRLDPRLLQRRLSRDPARVAGTVLTLSMGLGGFIAIHIWGGTLMSSFVPSPEWPDVIVSALPNGFSPEDVALVRGCPGVADGRVLAVDCSQHPFDPDSPAFAGRPEAIPRGAVLLFGADPDEAFGGEAPLARFRFVEGDRATAVRRMAEGDGCVVVEMLARLAGLRLGDVVKVAGRAFEVVGVVDLNWHMVTSRALVRTRFGREGATAPPGAPPPRTIGAAFVSERAVREITGNGDTTYFLWLNLSPELRRMDGLRATVRLDSEIRAAIRPDGSSAIRVHHRDEIADGTLSHGNDILGTMARIPFWSLVVTSMGIAALVVASVRGSRHEFETLRAVGMTHGQLLRLVFGEAMLVTLCAVSLSLLAGVLLGWSFTGLSRWMAAAGLPVRLIVPWRTILRGVAFALALCAAMAAGALRGLKV